MSSTPDNTRASISTSPVGLSSPGASHGAAPTENSGTGIPGNRCDLKAAADILDKKASHDTEWVFLKTEAKLAAEQIPMIQKCPLMNFGNTPKDPVKNIILDFNPLKPHLHIKGIQIQYLSSFPRKKMALGIICQDKEKASSLIKILNMPSAVVKASILVFELRGSDGKLRLKEANNLYDYLVREGAFGCDHTPVEIFQILQPILYIEDALRKGKFSEVRSFVLEMNDPILYDAYHASFPKTDPMAYFRESYTLYNKRLIAGIDEACNNYNGPLSSFLLPGYKIIDWNDSGFNDCIKIIKQIDPTFYKDKMEPWTSAVVADLIEFHKEIQEKMKLFVPSKDALFSSRGRFPGPYYIGYNSQLFIGSYGSLEYSGNDAALIRLCYKHFSYSFLLAKLYDETTYFEFARQTYNHVRLLVVNDQNNPIANECNRKLMEYSYNDALSCFESSKDDAERAAIFPPLEQAFATGTSVPSEDESIMMNKNLIFYFLMHGKPYPNVVGQTGKIPSLDSPVLRELEYLKGFRTLYSQVEGLREENRQLRSMVEMLMKDRGLSVPEITQPNVQLSARPGARLDTTLGLPGISPSRPGPLGSPLPEVNVSTETKVSRDKPPTSTGTGVLSMSGDGGIPAAILPMHSGSAISRSASVSGAPVGVAPVYSHLPEALSPRVSKFGPKSNS